LPVISEDSVGSHRTANPASSELGNPSTNPNQVVESGAKRSSSTVGQTLEPTHTTSSAPEQEEKPLPPQISLKPLTSLKWPYIPEEPSYPDPLKRDDPKPLSLAHYEAIGEYVRSQVRRDLSTLGTCLLSLIFLQLRARVVAETSVIGQTIRLDASATSPSIRKALSSNPNLPNLLRSIDRLRGAEREEELQRLLGISVDEGRGQFSLVGSSTSIEANRHGPRKGGNIDIDEEGMRALRELAAGVENAVRGDRKDVLGLDWEEA
jgi:hypothetical protein